MRRIVESGAIGPLRAFAATFTIPPLSKDDIRYRADLGGGALFDVGVYPLRVAQFFCGPSLAVRGANLRHGHGVDLGGEVLLRSESGITVQATFGMDGIYRSSYEFWGGEGHLLLDRAYTPAADHLPRVVMRRRDEEREIPLRPDDQYRNAAQAFADTVLGNAHGAHGAHGAEIIALAELVEAVKLAAARR